MAKSLLAGAYRNNIYRLFLKALKEYKLIEEGDHVMVAISGGKDSLTLAMCFKELENYSEIKFKTSYVVMNPGYSKENLELIKNNLKTLGIDAQIFDTSIFKISLEQEKNKCYICAKMRRGALYGYAEKIGANKVALGHHFDDVTETLLMSILYSGEVGGMRPILKSENFDNEYVIRPLYLVREQDIINYINDLGIVPLKSGCFMTKEESCEMGKRKLVKKLIKELDKDSADQVSKNIFKSMSNVNLGKMNVNK